MKTAEAFLKEELSLNEQMLIEEISTLPNHIVKAMKQYAKEKVLEALEEEFIEVDIMEFNCDSKEEFITSGRYYFENTLKPKYQ